MAATNFSSSEVSLQGFRFLGTNVGLRLAALWASHGLAA